MNFKLSKKSFILLSLLTLGIGILQILTPILMRVFVDGILPGKDLVAIASVVILIGANELFLLLGSSALNRTLDDHENEHLVSIRRWMLDEVNRPGKVLKNPEVFFHSWSNEARRLTYKKIKNQWFRTKDLVVLFLLTLICLNISYLAGIMVLIIAAASFILIKFHQENQSADVARLHQLEPQERKLFFQTIEARNEEKSRLTTELIELSNELNQVQHQIAQERSRFQDINGSIRFILMFSILSVGGYLFSREQVSMGSIWALILTMYRITPPLQSLARWTFQSRQDDNLEDRILKSLELKDSFKKPPYYNRLVKIIEKSLKGPSRKIVELNESIKSDEVLEALQLWQDFYSKKDSIFLGEKLPTDWSSFKTFLIVGEPDMPCPESVIFFCQRKVELTQREGWEFQNLD